MPQKHSPRIKLLKFREVAARLNVHLRTVERWVESGRLASFQLGPRSRRVLETDLERFLDSARIDLWEKCSGCGRSIDEPGGISANGLPLCPGCAGGGGGGR